jgi:hypothetical protein
VLSRPESLEARQVLDGSVVISEFMTSNDDGLLDQDGDDEDWVEIFNAGTEVVDLQGWHLTDDASDPTKWEFPSVELSSGEYLVVFASGKNRDLAGQELHTNFSLSSDGEYLALTRPDRSVASEFDPYPLQVQNVSYGIPSEVATTRLVGVGNTARVHIPTSNALDPDTEDEVIEGSWLDPALNTSGAGWFSATNGVGYWDESTDPNPGPGDGTVVANSVTEFNRTQGLNGWRYGYWNVTDDVTAGYDPASIDFRQFLWLGSNTVSQFNNWDGTKWDLAVAPATPNTELRADGAMPNGTNSAGRLHIPIRRWTSEVTGGILIHGNLNNADGTGDGVIAKILVEGQEVYARELNGASVDYQVILQVQSGQRVDFMIDPGPAGNDVGDNTTFTATIEDVTAQVGNGVGLPTLKEDISSDIETQMKNMGSSAYIRIPFTPTTADFDALTLRMKYQDAFVAYLNGQPIASQNGPGPGLAAWNSVANLERSIEDAVEYVSFDATQALGLLNPGVENILMIHAISASSSDDDVLAVAELVGTQLQAELDTFRYFTSPTPGDSNGLGAEQVGPLFRARTHSPNVPAANEPIVVTTDIAETFGPVATVELKYRVMYGTTVTVPMVDNGTGNDATAGDGIFTGTIPAGIAQPGQMVRWYMTAVDGSGNASRYPRLDDTALSTTAARDFEGSFGTIINDPSIDSNLPVIHTFLQNPAQADSDTTTYGSLFFDGEFYDSVGFDLHGQSTRSFPKKSYDVDFPSDHRFKWSDEVGRMKDFNLLSNYADKAKMRNTLAYNTLALTGQASHLAYPVRIQRNGSFYAVYDFVEDGDDRWLERMGLNPDNTLFKIYNTFFDTGSAERKAGDTPGNTDLQAFITGLSATGTALTNYIYDNVDLATMANYLAGFTFTSNRDCCHKNFYAYRDTHGNGEWSFFTWDNDLSMGRNWGGFGLSYHDYTIYADNPLNVGTNNNLIQKLYAIPEFTEMYLRRIRTLMDEIVGPPGESTMVWENMVEELRTAIGADGPVDHTRWGQVSSGTPQQPFETWPEAVNKILDLYIEPRREYLYNVLSVPPDPDGGGDDPEIVMTGDASLPYRYFVPVNNDLGTNWVSRTFDDSSWSAGVGGLGYEDSGTDYAPLINTRVKPTDAAAGATTVMARYTFDIATPADVLKMTLQNKYDDGFVAYINGIEVARAGFAGAVNWNSVASNHDDSAAVNFTNFAIDNAANRLNLTTTGNVLAIHIVNQAATSSDMLLLPQLLDGQATTTNGGPIPAEQPTTAAVEVGAIEFNPASGNQDQEFIEIVNNEAYAVDISGWEVAGAVSMTLRPGTVIPAGESLYITPSSSAFRARTTGPRGGQGLFVQDSYAGHLSNAGETIEIYNKAGTLISSMSYEGELTPNQESLRLSEIMYNALAPSESELAVNAALVADDFEYVELVNSSDSEVLNLDGVHFTSGITFDFTGSSVATLAPGARTLVVSNPAAFALRYGSDLNAMIAGTYTGSLSNGGESLKLEDADSSTIVDFVYDDSADAGWSTRADGQGSSLQLVDPAGGMGAGSNWRPSTEIHGSPGTVGVAPLQSLIVNEILSHTDLPQVDSIELYNPTGSTVIVTSFFLSDSAANLDSLSKFQLPAISVRSGEYVVFDETDFNSSVGIDPMDFGLSSVGDQVFLTVGDESGPTMFLDVVSFGAARNGESFGRYPNGAGALVPMSRVTLGCDNSSPRVGPLVISEVNYNPAAPNAAALAAEPAITASDFEFVEIHNPTSSAVTLTEWRLRGGVDFEFAEGSTLGASETLVVLSFNPDNPTNASRVAAFRAQYGIDASVTLVGGFSGRLDDAGERVTLQRPDEPPVEEPTTIPRLLEDEVIYDDVAPWATDADGMGSSLTRLAPTFFGSSAASWSASAPSPGSVSAIGTVSGDFNGDGAVTATDIDLMYDAIRAGHHVSYYDLNSDAVVNQTDANMLIQSVIGTVPGDINLDGVADVRDFNIWNAHKFQDCTGSYATGDINGDGAVDTSDFNIWNANRFTGSPLGAEIDRTPRAALAGRAVAVVRPSAADVALSQRGIESPALAMGLPPREVFGRSDAYQLRQTMSRRSSARWGEASQSIRGGEYAELADDVFAQGLRQ